MVQAVRTAPILAAFISVSLVAADWPSWRGPSGTGSTVERGLPVKWSATENVAWKVRVAGLGVSTPIVTGDIVVLTSQLGSSTRRSGNHPRLAQGADANSGERPLGESLVNRGAPTNGPTRFLVEAFSRADGRKRWEHRVEAAGPLPEVHDKHNMTSSSPVSDGRSIFAWFASGQIVALDMNGKPIWERHLGKEISPYDIIWGHSSSPTIFEDTLLLLSDHTTASYLLALDTRTGKEKWRADRGQGKISYSTPLVVPGANGPEVIVNSSERVDAYNARTGEHLWHTGTTNRFPVPSPLFHDGVIYLSRGYRSSPYMALRPGGRGDVTKTHVIWENTTGGPYVSSLVHDNGLIYMATDVGAITVVDAKDGSRVWQQRIAGVFSASPVAADGKVYFLSETGETVVIRAGRTPEVLSRNDLGERQIASPAVSRGQIFIRTDDHLFAIGRPAV